MLDAELFQHFGLPPESTRRTLAAPPPGKTVDADDLTRRLCLAVDYGHDSLVRLLLDADADVNRHNTRGVTALYTAARSGRLAIIETLLDAGASTEARCFSDGQYPLHGAALSGQLEVVSRLLAAGADVDERSGLNATPLHFACSRGHADVVRRLLSAKAPLDGFDSRGCTPLHLAAEGGRLEIARALLRAGARVDSYLERETGPPLLPACLGKARRLRGEAADSRTSAPRTATAASSAAGNKPSEATDVALEMITLLLSHGARADGPMDSRAAALDDRRLLEVAEALGAPAAALALLRRARDEERGEERRRELEEKGAAADRMAVTLLMEEAAEQRRALGESIRRRAAESIRQRAAAAAGEAAAERRGAKALLSKARRGWTAVVAPAPGRAEESSSEEEAEAAAAATAASAAAAALAAEKTEESSSEEEAEAAAATTAATAASAALAAEPAVEEGGVGVAPDAWAAAAREEGSAVAYAHATAAAVPRAAAPHRLAEAPLPVSDSSLELERVDAAWLPGGTAEACSGALEWAPGGGRERRLLADAPLPPPRSHQAHGQQAQPMTVHAPSRANHEEGLGCRQALDQELPTATRAQSSRARDEEELRHLFSHTQALQQRVECLGQALEVSRAETAAARYDLALARGCEALLGTLGLDQLEVIEAQAVGTLGTVVPLLRQARRDAVQAAVGWYDEEGDEDRVDPAAHLHLDGGFTRETVLNDKDVWGEADARAAEHVAARERAEPSSAAAHLHLDVLRETPERVHPKNVWGEADARAAERVAARECAEPSSAATHLSLDVLRETLERRTQARLECDYGLADRIRDELTAGGVHVNDKDNEWETADGHSGTVVPFAEGAVVTSVETKNRTEAGRPTRGRRQER